MRMCYATQIFSTTVVAGIKTAVQFNKFADPEKALATMHFCEKMDMLFDALNSKKQYDSNPNRTALKIENQPYRTLKGSLNFIREIKSCSRTKTYCFTGLLQTINGILSITDEFLAMKPDISFIITSRLNQDPCENLFSIIRQRGEDSRNPSVHHFNDIVAQIMSMKLIQPFERSNCEVDNDDLLIEPNNYLIPHNRIQLQIANVDENIYDESSSHSTQTISLVDPVDTIIESLPLIDECSEKYFFGYVVSRLKQKINCNDCEKMLLKSDEKMTLQNESFIFYKNFKKDSDFGSLHPPSEISSDISKTHIQIFQEVFGNEPQIKNIKKCVVDRCIQWTQQHNEYNWWFKDNHKCTSHHKILLDFMILVLIRKHCKWFLKSKAIKRNLTSSETEEGTEEAASRFNVKKSHHRIEILK